MKVIQVNVVADSGSTGKIVGGIDAELRRLGHESLVCYGRKTTGMAEGRFKFGTEWEAAASKVANRAGRLMYASSPMATRRLERRILQERPDVVHLHCINGYCVDIYRLLHFLAAQGIKTVITHHAEFFYTANCGHALDCLRFTDAEGCCRCPRPKAATGSLTVDRAHKSWEKMSRAFSAFAPGQLVFTAVSPWVTERSKLSPVTAGRECRVVENGLDDSVFCLADDRMAGRALVPGCREKMVLHVTASFSDALGTFKGGDEIVALARLMPEVTFVVAASYVDIKGELPGNLYVHGRTRDQHELAALYRAADATVIASKRETFSMIVAESLCCGTPVVGYRAGGPESIAIEPYSRFVDRSEGTSALADALKEMLSQQFDRVEISTEAIAKFSSQRMASNYINVYNSLLNK